MTALALVVMAVALAPAPADAARTKVITRNFSKPQQITIPVGAPGVVAASPYPSRLRVQGFDRGRILDVNVTLRNFSHDTSSDVDVMLSKGGRSCVLMSDVGGNSTADNIALRLDEEAANALPVGGPPVSGTFRPTNHDGGDGDYFYSPPPLEFPELSRTFDGTNPNGTWELRVVDDIGDEGDGQFAGGWNVTIRARVQT
jgi:hypothetical protein